MLKFVRIAGMPNTGNRLSTEELLKEDLTTWSPNRLKYWRFRFNDMFKGPKEKELLRRIEEELLEREILEKAKEERRSRRGRQKS